jgi:hypothetical protein
MTRLIEELINEDMICSGLLAIKSPSLNKSNFHMLNPQLCIEQWMSQSVPLHFCPQSLQVQRAMWSHHVVVRNLTIINTLSHNIPFAIL